MDLEDISTDREFLINTWRLHDLEKSLDKLEEAKVSIECNLDSCFHLMKIAAKGSNAANSAFGFAITQAARQARISITRKPKFKQMIDDIYYKRKRAKEIKVGLYEALYPFAEKLYEVCEKEIQ